MKPFVAFLTLVLTLAFAASAGATIVTSTDLQGRTITFDVRAPAVDTDWDAAVLRATSHGNEISDVTIRIVPDQSIESLCGSAAAACYTGIGGDPHVIPSGRETRASAGATVHENAHHT